MPQPARSQAVVTIREARPSDAAGIAEIYNHYVVHDAATFEEAPVGVDEIGRRMARPAALAWLVAELGGQILGYAYAAPWKARSAYRFSVEVTVYVTPGRGGQGIGTRLYTELFARLRAGGVHAVMAGIALPNAASVALHEKLGMRKVAHLREVGFKLDRWIDVGYWQRVLEPGDPKA